MFQIPGLSFWWFSTKTQRPNLISFFHFLFFPLHFLYVSLCFLQIPFISFQIPWTPFISCQISFHFLPISCPFLCKLPSFPFIFCQVPFISFHFPSISFQTHAHFCMFPFKRRMGTCQKRIGQGHLDCILIIFGYRLGIAPCKFFTVWVSSFFNSFLFPFSFLLFSSTSFRAFKILSFPLNFLLLPFISCQFPSFRLPFVFFEFPFTSFHFLSVSYKIYKYQFPFKFLFHFLQFLSFPSISFRIPFVSFHFLPLFFCFLSFPFDFLSFPFSSSFAFPDISFQMIKVELLGYRFWAFTISLYMVSSWFVWKMPLP